MANRIKLKRSNTGGSAPTTANIEVGEVAMNMADRLLYFRDPSNNILSFTIEDLNNFDTDDLTEGATNLYYTDTRVNANFSSKTTDALTEGTSNLYYTNTRARNAISVNDAGGFGTLSYDSSTGVITYTGTSTSEVTNSISVTGDLSYNSTTGVISYTESVNSVNGATGVVVLDTDDVSEGTTNLYYTDARVDTHLNTGTAATGEFLSWNGSDYDWVAGGGGGLADVVDDTTPQLGGNLDLNNFDITGTGNINITGQIDTTGGIVNDATSFGDIIEGKRNSAGSAILSSYNKGSPIADGDLSAAFQTAVRGSTSDAFLNLIQGRYHSTEGNSIQLKVVDDGISSFTQSIVFEGFANNASMFDGDLTLSTNGTHQTIGSTTGNITLAPGTSSNQIYANNGLSVTADGSVADPFFRVVNTENTPGNFNTLGSLEIWGKDSTNSYVKTANIYSYFQDDTNGSDNTQLFFETRNNGTNVLPFAVTNNAVMVTEAADNLFVNGLVSTGGGTIKLNNTDASLANFDNLGEVAFQDSYQTRARIGSTINDITGGSEDANLWFRTHINGVDTQQMVMESNRISVTNNLDVQDKWLQIQQNGSAPIQYLYRNDNHGNGASVGQIEWWGTDNLGGAKHYTTIRSLADNNNSGGVSGSIELQVMDNGTLTTVMSANSAVISAAKNLSVDTANAANKVGDDFTVLQGNYNMEGLEVVSDGPWPSVSLKQFYGGTNNSVAGLASPLFYTEIYGGTEASPTAADTNKRIFVLGGTAAIDTSGQCPTSGSAAIYAYTTEAQSSTNRGSKITIETIAQGTTTRNQVVVVDGNDVTINGTLDVTGNLTLTGYTETANTPATSGTISPDVSNGTYGVITLSGNITFNNFAAAQAGQSYTLVIKQPSSGGPYTLSSTMLFSGGGKTLSTAANAVDVMTVFYDGTSYYASLTTGYA